MSLSGDIVAIAVFWLLGVFSQDFLLIITALLIASGTIASYFFVKAVSYTHLTLPTKRIV